MPDTLVLHAGAAGSGTLIVDWAASRRAEGYRVKVQVAGEVTPRLFGIFPDDQTVLTALPLAKLLTITIIDYNQADDSAESPLDHHSGVTSETKKPSESNPAVFLFGLRFFRP